MSVVGVESVVEKVLEVTQWDGSKVNVTLPVKELSDPSIGTAVTTPSFSISATSFNIVAQSTGGQYLMVVGS